MGKQVHITRVAERFSSHTQTHPNTRARNTSGDTQTLRERLITATIEIIADGGDPRLGRSRARL